MERLTTDIARTLLEQYLKDPNNRIHSRESEVVMRALARRLSQDEELWGIAGLLHDLDWEQVGDNYSAHGPTTLKLIEDAGYELPEEAKHAILAHNEMYTEVKRESNFDYALAAGESVTGLIYAYALMRPEKLTDMKASSLNKKFKDKKFAANVSREFIADIEKTGIEKSEFFTLSIEAMQGIADEIFT